LEQFQEQADPRGMSRAVTPGEFAGIFHGQGQNAPSTPLEKIYPRAERLSLFVFTLGMRISESIQRLFAGNDFALGSVLDAVASVAADNAGRAAERQAERDSGGRGDGSPLRAFLYSPGYCGWHISGQKKLFACLDPGKIGVRLNESFLMTPLKSISGVLVAGPAGIHHVPEAYPFCARCQSPVCRERGMARSA
jgi:hypothetical protein